MADPDETPQRGPDEDEDDDEVGSTPFDNPFFLPALLLGFAVWFIYDGWVNVDEHMQQWRGFNRWGAGISVVLGVYFGVKAVRERRADSA